jgi:EmrB/QacA subfamily drug resistance transporter
VRRVVAEWSHRRATLVLLLACVFTVSANVTLLVVSLRTMAEDLGTSVGVVSWSITAPMLAFGVVGPLLGKCGDLWGHKRVFVGGLAVAGAFAAVTAAAWDPASMIVARTVSAAGGAALGPSAMAYIHRMFAPEERVRPVGYWSFVTAGAPVVGVVLGAPLVEAFGWRTMFLIQAPMCLAGCVAAAWLLHDTERQRDVRFDLRGGVLLALGATSVLLAINRGPAWGWTSASTLGVALVGVVALRWFVWVERRVEDPMLPLKWLRVPNVTWPVASQALTNFAYMGGFLVIPQMLEGGLGYTPSHIGWLVIARPLVFALAAPQAGGVARRLGERRTGMLGAAFVCGSMLMLAAVRDGVPDWWVMLGLSLSGLGLGIASPVLTALLSRSVASEDLGIASAMQQLVVQMGAVLGAAAMIGVHESLAGLGTIRSFAAALLVGAGVSVLGIGAAAMVRGTPGTRGAAGPGAPAATS